MAPFKLHYKFLAVFVNIPISRLDQSKIDAQNLNIQISVSRLDKCGAIYFIMPYKKEFKCCIIHLFGIAEFKKYVTTFVNLSVLIVILTYNANRTF